MEIFAACLGVTGILSLLGACMLIFRAGQTQIEAQQILNVAVRTHSDTMKSLADFRESSEGAHKQVQEWILETQGQIETSETKMTNVQDFCAKRYVATEKRMDAIESTFKQMSGTVDLLN